MSISLCALRHDLTHPPPSPASRYDCSTVIDEESDALAKDPSLYLARLQGDLGQEWALHYERTQLQRALPELCRGWVSFSGLPGLSTAPPSVGTHNHYQ